jgi:hypothetical protein
MKLFVDVGDAYATDPWPTARWDGTAWDDPVSRWSGVMPNWSELSCRVRTVEIDRGRPGLLDIFTPGRATVEVDNSDGWATWSPDAPGPVTAGSWLRVRADDVALFTGRVRQVADLYAPGRRPGARLLVTDPLARLATARLAELAAPVGAGDTAAQRIGRVLDAIGVPAEHRDLQAGGALLAATRYGATAADLCQQAAVAAGGALYAARDGRITYRDAGWLRTDPRSVAAVARITNTPTAPLPAPTPNLLTQNQATAEDGTTTGWALLGGNTLTSDASSAAEGVRCVVATRTTGTGSLGCNTNPGTPIKGGQRYTFMASFRGLAIAGPNVALMVRWYDAAGALLATEYPAVVPWSPAMEGQWTAMRAVTVAPSTAATVRVGVWQGAATNPAGSSLAADRMAVNEGDVTTWYPPDHVFPTAPLQVCATGMEPNGPDIDRVVNDVTVSGVDAATDPAGTREVTRADVDSQARWGVGSWSLSQLPTVSRSQLDAIAGRALALRRAPAPHLEAVTLSPLADPAAAPLVQAVDFGDRLAVDYQDPTGWGWAFDVHVHAVRHEVRPAGDDNEAASWTTTLTLDDASHAVPGTAWDYGAWDTATWSSP